MEKIYARETIIEVIDNEIASSFLEENHRQKSTLLKQKITSIALFHNSKIVGIAQFCMPRTEQKQRKYSTELLRLAFKKDIRVIGGASKLVKFFINQYSISDIFTYQDATGENTDVYEHAGFSFVSQEKKKEYLVAPGKTIQTGNRKEVLGMPYATKYGSDRILGTKIGEILDPETGKRKSNKRIFIEELGWHIETTPGDKVYEWFDKNITFYTYKITATDSDKYYYGMSHIKKENATIQDCLDDRYYGSGSKKPGNKFHNWKIKHSSQLIKEVLFTTSRKAEAYENERELIGDLYITDRRCLNSAPGGRIGLAKDLRSQQITTRECIVHGLTKHQGNTCAKCRNVIVTKHCEIHGQTKFQGESCAKCVAAKSMIDQECAIHGKTKHRKNHCLICLNNSSVSHKECIIHGLTKFQGDTCAKCNSSNSVSLQICEVHGETKFQGETCARCNAGKNFSVEECSVHGFVKFRNGSCVSCSRFRNSPNLVLNELVDSKIDEIAKAYSSGTTLTEISRGLGIDDSRIVRRGLERSLLHDFDELRKLHKKNK